MKRTDAARNLANMFQDGDTELGVKGTQVESTWLNNVQEELCNIVEEAGITLDGDDNTQVLQALQELFFSVLDFEPIGYQLDLARYAKKSKSVAAQGTSLVGISFNTDGTKMYFLDGLNDIVYQYTLPTAWDVSSATYASLSKDVSAQDSLTSDVSFSSDGTKMYILGRANNTVYQYTLSTAWDVSSATYASLSKSVAAQDINTEGLDFSSDGTKMYCVGPNNNTVYQYTLSTAWDVSSATYASLSKSVVAQESGTRALAFSSDGTRMFILATTNDTVYEYTLSTAWDVSSATYASLSKSVAAQGTTPTVLTFSADGTKMYFGDDANNTFYQYYTHFIAFNG